MQNIRIRLQALKGKRASELGDAEFSEVIRALESKVDNDLSQILQNKGPDNPHKPSEKAKKNLDKLIANGLHEKAKEYLKKKEIDDELYKWCKEQMVEGSQQDNPPKLKKSVSFALDTKEAWKCSNDYLIIMKTN